MLERVGESVLAEWMAGRRVEDVLLPDRVATIRLSGLAPSQRTLTTYRVAARPGDNSRAAFRLVDRHPECQLPAAELGALAVGFAATFDPEPPDQKVQVFPVGGRNEV